MFRTTAAILIVLFLPAAAANAQIAAVSQTPGAMTLLEMLRDPLLWGPDFPAALKAIPGFATAGEAQVHIQRRRVFGARRFEQRADAEQAAAIAAKTNQSPPRMRVQVVTPAAQKHARVLPAVVALVVPDDRTIRIGTPDHDAQYLIPDVPIDHVFAHFGKPERVTVEFVDDGTDAQPDVWTLHHYANGALIVVTTNGDRPFVSRILLDTRAVVRAIFEE